MDCIEVIVLQINFVNNFLVSLLIPVMYLFPKSASETIFFLEIVMLNMSRHCSNLIFGTHNFLIYFKLNTFHEFCIMLVFL